MAPNIPRIDWNRGRIHRGAAWEDDRIYDRSRYKMIQVELHSADNENGSNYRELLCQDVSRSRQANKHMQHPNQWNTGCKDANTTAATWPDLCQEAHPLPGKCSECQACPFKHLRSQAVCQ